MIGHTQARRYTSPDEFPFSRAETLPPPVLGSLDWPKVLKPHSIELNPRIMEAYLTKMVPELCAEGDDQQYGSSAVADIACLQALSKRYLSFSEATSLFSL